MSIRVEFYGIARQRAGQPFVALPVTGPVSLGTVIERLATEFPQLALECLSGNRLRAGYVANIDGARFLGDPDSMIDDNSSLLIMSADAGG